MSTATNTATPPKTQTELVAQPYLNFEGRCEEALAFYQKAIDAKVDCILRFSDAPEPSEQCADAEIQPDKVMHCQFRIGESIVMASDCSCTGKTSFSGISLALTASTAETAKTLFNALSEGGTIAMPLNTTFFAQKFGVVIDRFGVSWMIVGAPTNP